MDSISLKPQKILVHIYGYKEHRLLSVVDNLISNLSGDFLVDVYIDDQNNLTRYEKFISYKNVFYNPVWWDELLSPLSYRQSCIDAQKNNGYDYFLFLSKPYLLPNNWDKVLIESLPEDSVFSGMGIVEHTIKDGFHIDKTYRTSSQIENTGYIDQSFIFGKLDNLLKINLPWQLKYYGIDEYISISFLNRGISIYSLPSSYCEPEEESLLIKDYVPFSLNHNYNDVIEILTNNKSFILKYEDPQTFINKNQIDINLLNKLPFSFNDIEYNRFSELDNIGGKRYIEKRDHVS